LEKIFQLDKFLTIEYMKELVQTNGFKIVNQPPHELEQTLVYYKQLLNNSLKAPYIMNEEENVQVKIPVNQEEYYLMRWNIPKLKYLIKRHKIPKTQISVNLVKSLIQQSNTNPGSNNLQNDDKEIIIASYPPIRSKYLILKGNKEKFEKVEKDEENIESFIFDPYVHLQATSNIVYRSLFSIHFNYSLLCSYIAGQLTLEEIEKRVFPVY
jgi:hypothetical protein